MRSRTRTTKKAIRCASCTKKIRSYEPDLVLEDVSASGGDAKPRYYHDRCGRAAYQLAMERPAVYVLTVRHVEASRN